MLAPDDPRHGTANGYNNLKCRCDRCRQAWADYCWRSGWQTRYNRKKGHRPIEVYNAERAARHGTATMYKNGCRCDGCRLASADAKRAWRKKNPEAARAYDREYQKRRRSQT